MIEPPLTGVVVETYADLPETTMLPAEAALVARAIAARRREFGTVRHCAWSGLVLAQGYGWIAAGTGVVETYVRSVAFGAIAFVALCALPIVAKWTLVGRWQPTRIRIWGLAYVRFWLAARLIRTAPPVLFVGTPLYPLYLRALGARIGPGAAILRS